MVWVKNPPLVQKKSIGISAGSCSRIFQVSMRPTDGLALTEVDEMEQPDFAVSTFYHLAVINVTGIGIAYCS